MWIIKTKKILGFLLILVKQISKLLVLIWVCQNVTIYGKDVQHHGDNAKENVLIG